jgi:hypothetical protein
MTDILDDSYESDLTDEEHERLILMSEHALAAALRATADQLCLRWSELSHPADVLNNIADELDAQ